MTGEHDPEYVDARRVLLDALDALGSHRKAVVLVGAQAIYLRVGQGDLQVAPFTSDGDLALNPSVLDDEPILAEALQAAGFALAVKPGTWARDDIQIDLLVPSSLGGAGRRSARLGPHGTAVARKAKGLEAAIVDNDVVTLTALDPSDAREIDVAVAGVGALLVAKLHKLAERETAPSRWAPKDGLDVLRILQSANLPQLGATLAGLERHALAGASTSEARPYLRRLFGRRDAHGAAMAVRASVGLEDPATIAGACAVLANELLVAWESALAEKT
ncbi:MAG: hypothetical protein A2289_21270 [Deltaproteobacteria bacterium RIFOXYA12_FULL_58_15]|nr:MAG: hypothetical protein A2289_21270 [Deltaproteobacteria bacterium RIFOXYA12_FULL_58_15]OGR13673.1 MAG: hypothetical protein A2341_08745 [Deltaproteobacteria bacterium RIFOXYB12_FULL_58_9]